MNTVDAAAAVAVPAAYNGVPCQYDTVSGFYVLTKDQAFDAFGVEPDGDTDEACWVSPESGEAVLKAELYDIH